MSLFCTLGHAVERGRGGRACTCCGRARDLAVRGRRGARAGRGGSTVADGAGGGRGARPGRDEGVEQGGQDEDTAKGQTAQIQGG